MKLYVAIDKSMNGFSAVKVFADAAKARKYSASCGFSCIICTEYINELEVENDTVYVCEDYIPSDDVFWFHHLSSHFEPNYRLCFTKEIER